MIQLLSSLFFFFKLTAFSYSITPPGAPKNFEIFDYGRNEIEKRVQNFDGLVVVDFQAPWCIDCKILSYQLPRVIKSHPDVLFLVVDVDRVRTARQDFQVRHIPHVSFFYGNLTELASIVEGNGAQVDSKIKELKAKIGK